MNRRLTTMLVASAFVFLFVAASPAVCQKRSKLENKIYSLMEQLKAAEKDFISPSAADHAAFGVFLAQPDTGVIRLLPRERYDGKLLTRGGGAYYSFARSDHEYGYGSDVSLEREQFGVGFAGADFGFLVNLGDEPIESISVEHPGVKFLADFVAPTVEGEAREQYRRGYPGFEAGGFTYASRMGAALNTTYAVRSVCYRDSDVLVAFRVVRQDSDGSLILLYKTLKKFQTPELARKQP